MMNNPRALYLHIPFCLSKCRYCDFCSFPSIEGERRQAYLNALAKEISSLPTGELDSLYIGGGTPSLLSPNELEALLSSVSSRFSFTDQMEFTLEMNPKTAELNKLKDFRSLGVSRLSLGVQSFSDRLLSILGRAHTAQDARLAYYDARNAGFENINLDLMYGLPWQSVDDFGATLSEAISLSPEHLSVYGLIIEDGTCFGEQRQTLVLPDEDAEFDMYLSACRMLKAVGYLHDEVSNYAKPGYACRHNHVYWEQKEYYAAGLSASSFVDGWRRTNTRDFDAYIASPCRSTEESVQIAGKDAEFEYMMLALRTAKGVNEGEFARLFGEPMRTRYQKQLAPYTARGLFIQDAERLALTDEGMYLSSAVLTDLLPE